MNYQLVAKLLGIRTVASRDEAPPAPAPAARVCAAQSQQLRTRNEPPIECVSQAAPKSSLANSARRTAGKWLPSRTSGGTTPLT